MVIRRGGRLPPSPILMSSAAGRSFSKSYAMPTRSVGAFYPGRSRASSVLHDSRADDYYLFDRVSDVSYLSNATLDTSDDTVRRSRGRDQKLLRDATSAIPSRGSVRDTSALTSSATPFGPRRFPRRVGKPTLRKNQSSSFYATSLAPNSNEAAPTKGLSTSDAMASASPAPSSGSWRRYGGSLPRSASEARSFYQDVEASLDKAPRKPRAMSVDPYLSSPSYTPTMGSPVLSRRSMPPPPLSTLSESRLLNTGRVGSTTYTRPTYSSAPVHPGYEPVYVEFEPENKPVYPTRRRPRVLASARRPAGNYYQRLLRKRGKQQGRFGPYYDLESIEGSDLSVLSDTGSLDGTYEVGYDDIDCTGVSPPSSPPTYRRILDLPSSSSPYYVDQDTEFVPFGPSRPLQTKGLFELSPYDADDDDVDVECYNSRALPSPTTDLSLSTYLPSHLTPPSLKAPTATAPSVSLPPLPYRSVVPYTSSLATSSPAVPSSHIPSQQLFESLIASSIQRAKSALNTLAIPAYQGASLVLSVEGAGLSPEGKRVGFTYTPPPIPLYGRSPRLDDNLLAIKPSATVKPVDSFLAGYMDRMQALRLALNTGLDRDRSRRLEYGLAPLETGPRLSTTSTHTPSYTQSHEYVPVKHLTSQKLDRLPVTTYRSRYDDGRTHRVDVFSLGEIQPRLPDSSRAIKIPESATGGYELSVLDKINIKVSSESYATPQTSVVARRVVRGRSLAPRAASLPPRPYYPNQVDSGLYIEESTTNAADSMTPYYEPYFLKRRPVVLYEDPLPPARKLADRARSVPPVVVLRDSFRPSVYSYQYEPRPEDWRSRMRARSVPPAMMAPPPPRYLERRQYSSYYVRRPRPVLVPQQVYLPTTGLTAHRVPRLFLTREPVRSREIGLWGYYGRRSRQVEEPVLGYYGRRSRQVEEPVRGYYGRRSRQVEEPVRYRRTVNRARVLATPVYRAPVARGRGRYALPYYTLPSYPKPKPATLRESLIDFPQVYVPRKGKGPSNRSKAAIIASKMEPDPMKRRRPRSEYAAKKYRQLRMDSKDSIYSGLPSSGGLRSSVPSAPRPSDRKIIRTEDGYSKPKNLLSWQYRLDSMINPKDVLYEPASFGRIRSQVRNAQERMDRHRQMIDRYLPEEGEDSTSAKDRVLRKMADMEKHDPVIGGGVDTRRPTVTIPNYYACGGDPSNPPMSDLRRRIRRTLNKTRHSSVF